MTTRFARVPWAVASWVLAWAVWVPAAAGGQSPESEGVGAGLYADPHARVLHARAMDWHADHGGAIRSYVARVRQRAAVSLRTPLKDRTLYRFETAKRVHWLRDGPLTVQLLGLREHGPGGLIEEDFDPDMVDSSWDPGSDPLFFGAFQTEDEDDPDAARAREGRGPGPEIDGEPATFRLRHPLEPEDAEAYAFASGDTIALSLPDGRVFEAVELTFSPRVRGPDRLAGALWIERGTGALVRAVYRLSESLDVVRDIEDVREEDEEGEFRWIPGLFKPWTFDLTVVTVDFTLWEGRSWLPRRLRGEGLAGAGILKFPASFDVAYTFEGVQTEDPASDAPAGEPAPERAGQERGPVEPVHIPPGYEAYEPGRQAGDEVDRSVTGTGTANDDEDVRIYVPSDLSLLRSSPELPPPVWEDAPGFTTADELEELTGALRRVPSGPSRATPRWIRWGPQRPDLIRYNRVEGASVGARAAVAPDLAGRPLSLTATARFGSADRHLNGRVDAERGSLSRTVTLSGYHELEAVERGARHLGIGNSLIALLGGRDDGDYFRRSGASLTLTPPASGRAVYRVAIHSEYHEPVRPETRTSLVRLWEESDWSFRENVRAREGWEHAVEVTLSPWWGTDPTRAQFGLSWSGGAALGDLEHARSSLLARAVIPVAPAWRLGLAAGAGAATSNTPAQRTFGVGGATTLRGYDPRTLTGPCTGHARVEIQRAVVFGGVAAFADAGWAGACDGWDASDALRSLGVGASILDGLIRFDLAHGLDDPAGFRLELYLDGIL